MLYIQCHSFWDTPRFDIQLVYTGQCKNALQYFPSTTVNLHGNFRCQSIFAVVQGYENKYRERITVRNISAFAVVQEDYNSVAI